MRSFQGGAPCWAFSSSTLSLSLAGFRVGVAVAVMPVSFHVRVGAWEREGVRASIRQYGRTWLRVRAPTLLRSHAPTPSRTGHLGQLGQRREPVVEPLVDHHV